jgi:hypothetical protein
MSVPVTETLATFIASARVFIDFRAGHCQCETHILDTLECRSPDMNIR